MKSLFAATTTAVLTGLAAGEVLTIIDPCPAAPKSVTDLHQSITVTEQHQPVSTCTGGASNFGWSTYDWVSTVIPCWGGANISSCTVTDVTQVVPCTGASKTITSLVPTVTHGKHGRYHSYNQTKYETISKLWVAPYNALGPLAIPEFEGCDLCTECGVQEDGSKKQVLNVTECSSSAGSQPMCSKYVDTWISRPAPSTTGAVTATVSQHTAVPSAGVFTFYFPQPAPSTPVWSNQQWYTIPGEPWTASVTRSYPGPTECDIFATVTKTVTFSVPYSTMSGSQKTPAPEGFGEHGWAAWNGHQNSETTTTAASQAAGWSGWDSSESSSATPTHTSQPWDQQSEGSGWQAWSQSSNGLTSTSTQSSSGFTSTSTQSSSGSTSTSTQGGNGPTSTSTQGGNGPTSTSTQTGGGPVSTSTSTTLSTSTSSNTGSTSSTGITSTTGTQTTSSTVLTSSTTTAGTPQDTSFFYLEVDYTRLRRRYAKRADATYVGFLDGSDDASVVTASQNPALFNFDSEGYLRVGAQYIAADSSTGYFVFEKTSIKPTSPPPYQRLGEAFTRKDGGGFCATSANLFVALRNPPSDCRPVILRAVTSLMSGSTTTTSTTSSRSTSTSTSTSTQPDVSADLAVPDPTSFVRRSARY